MKKFLGIFCAAVLSLSAAACAPKEPPAPQPASSPDTELSISEEPTPEPATEAEQYDGTVRVMALKGPTAMGMVHLMERHENGVTDIKCNFEIVGTADEIVSRLTTGEVDIAAVPANLAATLYNKTEGGIKVCAVNTLGVLYILDTTGTVNTIQDLKGKTVYSVGKGTTPEFALNHVLEKNGLASDVTVEYKSEATELAALLESGQAELAMLPEPYVTSVLAQNADAKVALSLTEEWNIVQPEFKLITGTIVTTKKFAEENKEALNAFLEDYKKSVEFVSSPSNVETASIMVVKYGIVPDEQVAKESLPRCNIVYIDGSSMKRELEGYLGVLFDAEPKSVGGKLPEEDFYYTGI